MCACVCRMCQQNRYQCRRLEVLRFSTHAHTLPLVLFIYLFTFRMKTKEFNRKTVLVHLHKSSIYRLTSVALYGKCVLQTNYRESIHTERVSERFQCIWSALCDTNATIVWRKNEGNFDAVKAETKTTDKQTDNRLLKSIRKNGNGAEQNGTNRMKNGKSSDTTVHP